MNCLTTAGELATSIKAGESQILIDGFMLETAVDVVRRPLRWLAVLPLSSIVGSLGAVGIFLLFFFSKWILLLVGLLLLNGESIGLWPKILFCMKVGAVVPPIMIVCYTAYVLVVVVVCGGGFSALRRLRGVVMNVEASGGKHEKIVCHFRRSMVSMCGGRDEKLKRKESNR